MNHHGVFSTETAGLAGAAPTNWVRLRDLLELGLVIAVEITIGLPRGL